MPKKKRLSSAPASKPAPKRLPFQAQMELMQADMMAQSGAWSQARAILQNLDARYPKRPEILTELANLAASTNDAGLAESSCSQLLQITPEDADVQLALASAYALNERPLLAVETWREFLDRWPKHERADEVRQILEHAEPHARAMLATLPLAELEGEAAWEVGALDRLNSLLELGQIEPAREQARWILERQPQFAAALNNLSQIEWLAGDATSAIATSRRVLETDAHNIHALSNALRFCVLSGRADEARDLSERLKQAPFEGHGPHLKKMEALSYLGDDEGVLQVLEHAQSGVKIKLEDATALHLAAVASLRLGREAEAKKMWKRALKMQPGHSLASESLQDLKQPVGQRHAPWPFPLANWLLPSAIEGLSALASKKSNSEAAAERALRGYLQRHPEVTSLVPLLLDRGDPPGREFALGLASIARTPEMLQSLRDFALGQRGPDATRHQAAMTALDEGLIEGGSTRLWWAGQWQDLMLMGFELHDEATFGHTRAVQELLARAGAAMRQNSPLEAENLYRQAAQVEPDAPDLQNNIAAALSAQDRHEEAHALLRQIHTSYPDYVFASISLARIAISEGRLDEARALLEPIYQRRRLHFSEHAAWCDTQIDLFLADNSVDVAASWLSMWEGAAELGDPRVLSAKLRSAQARRALAPAKKAAPKKSTTPRTRNKP